FTNRAIPSPRATARTVTARGARARGFVSRTSAGAAASDCATIVSPGKSAVSPARRPVRHGSRELPFGVIPCPAAGPTVRLEVRFALQRLLLANEKHLVTI